MIVPHPGVCWAQPLCVVLEVCQAGIPRNACSQVGGGAEDEAGKEAGQTPKAPIGLFVNRWDLGASSQGGGSCPCLIQWDLRCHPESYQFWAQALESLRPGSKYWSHLLLTPSPGFSICKVGKPKATWQRGDAVLLEVSVKS